MRKKKFKLGETVLIRGKISGYDYFEKQGYVYRVVPVNNLVREGKIRKVRRL